MKNIKDRIKCALTLINDFEICCNVKFVVENEAVKTIDYFIETQKQVVLTRGIWLQKSGHSLASSFSNSRNVCAIRSYTTC